MPRHSLLLLLVMLTLSSSASAADLAARPGIGAIFDEPTEVIVVAPRRELPMAWGVPVFAPQVDIPPLVNGYYGKPNSYEHNSYYGTSPLTIFSRLPYACGFHGYC